ncbi:hypothetical protein H6F51_12715 [Cyanobacteria bacterium FACHB-DQ100]|uniref:DUF6335 family protein n=1 Tax=unclassified Leptolyngbya TaxID=2650499 RepID=UPI00168010D9|nr:DUF6335 family protein [Leptolyngbya sp. FACHB-17]MBD1823343.1 hypothetical protein [Cyanobacteria bacterium FACHB-DQ100]MBD2083233.1 hypothetical protein [Leptolyngbya sp. FACHB-17]
MTYNKSNPGYQDISDDADLEAALHNLGGDVYDEEDDLEEEQDFGDVPQEYTESYGTGVVEMPGYTIGGRTMRDRESELNEASAVLTGGDIDANYEQANAVGDESVGGTVSTPDMDIVDEIGRAVGLEMSDYNYLHTNEILEGRDDRRWELEPSSSEDYEDRRNDEI